MKLTLTEACNLACPYCYQRTRSAQCMSLETLHASLALARHLGRGEVKVVLSGGEPLLAPDLVTAVLDAVAASEAARPRLRVRLITNGTLLRSSLLERLVEVDAAVQVSCDGVEAAQDARAPGSWHDLNRLLETVRHQHPRFWRRRLSVAMTVTPSNVAHLSDSVAWALARDVRRLVVGLAYGLETDWGERACAVLEDQMARVFALSVEHLRCTERVPVTYLGPTPDAQVSSADACGAAGPSALAVAADGSVHGCGLLADVARWHPSDRVRHAADMLRLGHVADPGLEAHWRQLAARPPAVMFPIADRTAKAGACHDCPQREECLVCPVAGPDPRRVPDAHCLFERLVQRQRNEMPRTSPVESVLAAAGVSASLSARLSSLVWQARQEI